MELLARTQISMWEGGGLWIVDATPAETRIRRRTDFHAHHAIQIVIGLGASFQLGTTTAAMTAPVVAVAADTDHDFEAEGPLALLFVEPESRAGRAISAQLFATGNLTAVSAPGLDALIGRISAAHGSGLDHDGLAELGQAIVRCLAGDGPADRPDHRVRKMIARAASQIDSAVSLADVVDEGGLSAGRLRHLFVEQTGLPFKTYVLWLRLMRSVKLAAAGASLTEAAHEAGFSDSAHFSRTFRRMFGVAPAALRMT